MAYRDLDEYRKQKCQEAILWARNALSDQHAVILDTETTGLQTSAEIVDIAIIDSQGKTLLNQLLSPRGKIPREASAVHGITTADVATAPPWPGIHNQVEHILRSASIVVIYNAEYDLRLLHQTCALYQLSMTNPRYQVECAMKRYAQFVGEWNDVYDDFRWQRLKGANHRALGDCMATLRVMKEMAAVEIHAEVTSMVQGQI